MKRISKTAGVTLLEIMLVLAVAAMVIVMSIRYYQGAQVSQQTNSTLQQIQAISAGADNMAIGGGSYSAIGTAGANLWAVIGSGAKMSATNVAITIGPVVASSYGVTIPLTPAVCASVLSKIKSNTKISNASPAPACSPAGVLTYTYDNTK